MVLYEFLFPHAWNYQRLSQNLQSDINAVIHDVQVALSNVLETSTEQTLNQYESHINDIEKIYLPLLADYNTIVPGDCRNTAEQILNMSTSFTGFSGSNCASAYNTAVSKEIEAANLRMGRVDELYYQVQTIVVKSFMGQNSFLTPESIEDQIKEIYDLVNARWTISKPEMDDIRRNFKAAVTEKNNNLSDCNGVTLTSSITLFALLEQHIKTCEVFNNTPGVMSFRAGANAEPFQQVLEEFKSVLSQLKPYEWKA